MDCAITVYHVTHSSLPVAQLSLPGSPEEGALGMCICAGPAEAGALTALALTCQLHVEAKLLVA